MAAAGTRAARGRPTKDGAKSTIPTQVMLAEEHRAWLQKAGGSHALRRLIDQEISRATAPGQTANPPHP